MIQVFLAISAIFVTCFYIWQKINYNYWKRHHVKYIDAFPLVGNLREMCLMRQSFGEQMWTLYKNDKFKNEPLIGIYNLHRPAILLRDVQLIKRIFIQDSNQFTNRFIRTDTESDPVGSYNLFLIRTPHWRELRTKLTPVFTSGKMKQMYPLMQEIGQELDEYLQKIPDNSIIEVKNLSGRFTTDLIATVAFGIKSNSIQNSQSEFYIQCRMIFEITAKRAFDFFSFLLLPSVSKLLHLKFFRKCSLKFLRHNIRFIMEERERNGFVRNDLIDVLRDMKHKASQKPDQPSLANNLDYLVAQAAVFQTAGYESPSSAMAFALYELAMHPEVQDRLRDEITNAFDEEGDLVSYECIHKLPYLDQVVNETLRKYPTLPFLDREYSPELGENGYSLKPYNDFVMPSGMPVYVSILGLHRDKKYWPNPEQFDPERFAPENRSEINWDAYMPFGTGPRNCIGTRMGLLQTKLGLIHALRNYRVSQCSQTPPSICFEAKSFALASKEGIYLRFERATD